MNKAFIFDMDGVIVNSETVWKKREKRFLTELLGDSVYKKIKYSILGSTTHSIYELACKNGLKIEKDLFIEKFDQQALSVYQESELTKNIDALLSELKLLNFKVGLVTASSKLWIEQVMPKIKNKEIFECILSLAQREDLKPKPHPDGYLEAIRILKSTPDKTIILEDSHRGVSAAKASGAFTICLTEHVLEEDIPGGADRYVKTVKELISQIKAL